MASKPDVWMPLYIADYVQDTQHFSTTEHGAYLLILMHAWTNDGALPADPERLRLIARMSPKEWKASWPVLGEKLPVAGSMRRNKRIDLELAKAKGMVQQRSEAGKVSAEKRWGKRNYNENDNEPINETSNESVTKSLRKNAPLQTTNVLPSPLPPPPHDGPAGADPWQFGKEYLVASGIARSSAGSVIGKWAKEYGHPAVISALQAAIDAKPAQPIEYVAAILQNRPKKFDPVASNAAWLRNQQ